MLPEHAATLKAKQGGSKERACKNWGEAQKKAQEVLEHFSTRDILIFMAGIYWGEGTKTSLTLINGDPYLVRSFIQGLCAMGIKKNDIKLSLRLFSDMDETKMIDYWLEFLDFDKKSVCRSEIIKGNGTNKLPHGMCRVRVLKGARHFKHIMSMIDLIKSHTLPL